MRLVGFKVVISDYIDGRKNIRSICPLVDTIDCSRTEFIEENVSLMRVAIASGTSTQTVSIQDTISKHYGNLDGTSYCGSRTYTLDHEIEWLSFDNDVLTISSVD